MPLVRLEGTTNAKPGGAPQRPMAWYEDGARAKLQRARLAEQTLRQPPDSVGRETEPDVLKTYEFRTLIPKQSNR